LNSLSIFARYDLMTSLIAASPDMDDYQFSWLITIIDQKHCYPDGKLYPL
jgi:hypothetical protein